MGAPIKTLDNEGVDLERRQSEIIRFFLSLGDEMSRYSYLIEISNTLPLLQEKYRTDGYKVDGCQSNVWLFVGVNDEGRIIIEADSDSFIVKGILAVLSDLFDGVPAVSVSGFTFTFLEDTGLDTLFSPERKNGVSALIAKIKSIAAEKTQSM